MSYKGAAMIAGAILIVGLAWLYLTEIVPLQRETEASELEAQCSAAVLEEINPATAGGDLVQVIEWLTEFCVRSGGAEQFRSSLSDYRARVNASVN